MGGTTRRDLFLSVNANLDQMQTAMKAGRSTLVEFGTAANDTTEQVQEAFRKLGGGDVEATAKSIDQAYARTFQNIRANAAAVASATDGKAALQILDSAGAEKAAAAAEAQAAGLRMVADAAARAAAAEAGDATAARVYATAAEAAAIGARDHAVALRTQADVLSGVRRQLGATADAEDQVTAAHNRMTPSGMILQHVIRSTGDSLAAGLPLTMIFGEQIGRLGEAAALSGGQFGKFGAFMSTGWGMGISLGIAVLGPLVSTLFKAGDAAEKAKKAEEEYASFQSTLANFIDLSNGKLREKLRLLAQVALYENRKKIQEKDEYADTQNRKAFEAATPLKSVMTAGAPTAITASTGDRQLEEAIRAAGGDAGKLFQNLVALHRADLKPIIEQVAHFAGETAHARVESEKLKGEQNELRTLLQGGAVLTTAMIGRQVDEELATTRLEKATARLNAVKARGAEIDAMIAGKGKDQALAKYHADLSAATAEVSDAQKAAKKKPKGPSVGTQVDEERGKELFGIAQRYLGLSETRDKRQLETLFGNAGIKIDPETVKWCAAFVQAVLAVDGLPHSDKLGARSFLQYGEKTDKPVKGDIVVLSQGGQDHVGFYDSEDKNKKTVRILSGNTGNKVAYENVPLRSVLGFRRAPDGAHQLEAETAEANRDRAFQGELAQAQSRYAKALLALTDTAEGRLAVELDDLRSAKAQRDLEIDDQVKAGKIGEAQGQQLKVLNASTEALQEVKAKRDEQAALIDRQLQHVRTELDGQLTLLNLQGDLADTAKERERIALQILDYQEREARATLKAAIAKEQDPDRKADLIGQYNRVGAEYSLRRERVYQDNEDPLQAYMRDLHGRTDDVGRSLKEIQVLGLSGLASDTASSVTQMLKLHGAIGQVIEALIRLGLEKEILAGLKLLGQGASQFSVQPTSEIFDGGGGLGNFDIASEVFGHATGYVPGFAAGGTRIGNLIRGPGTGTSDSIMALLGTKQPIKISNGESIMTERATRLNAPWLEAMNKGLQLPAFADGRVPDVALPAVPNPHAMHRPGAAGGQPLYFDLRGAVVTEDILDDINNMGRQAAIDGGHLGAGGALTILKRRSARALPTRAPR
jgi:uncharacterized protein (TIGR02594 family)